MAKLSLLPPPCQKRKTIARELRVLRELLNVMATVLDENLERIERLEQRQNNKLQRVPGGENG